MVDHLRVMVTRADENQMVLSVSRRQLFSCHESHPGRPKAAEIPVLFLCRTNRSVDANPSFPAGLHVLSVTDDPPASMTSARVIEVPLDT